MCFSSQPPKRAGSLVSGEHDCAIMARSKVECMIVLPAYFFLFWEHPSTLWAHEGKRAPPHSSPTCIILNQFLLESSLMTGKTSQHSLNIGSGGTSRFWKLLKVNSLGLLWWIILQPQVKLPLPCAHWTIEESYTDQLDCPRSFSKGTFSIKWKSEPFLLGSPQWFQSVLQESSPSCTWKAACESMYWPFSCLLPKQNKIK